MQDNNQQETKQKRPQKSRQTLTLSLLSSSPSQKEIRAQLPHAPRAELQRILGTIPIALLAAKEGANQQERNDSARLAELPPLSASPQTTFPAAA
ncbi:hypothetical protein [Synechococcus elongatus]|uniref:hypothetical protein n=1 Tax=Synechococcus elongatus TaxID=32046 RepID=UPI0030D3C329